MNVTYSDQSKQGPEGSALLQQATRRLHAVLGPAAETVQAEWDRTQDPKGRPLYTLRISDGTDSVTASFAPDELESPFQAEFRLLRLWDNLLQKRNQRQLEELLKADGSES